MPILSTIGGASAQGFGFSHLEAGDPVPDIDYLVIAGGGGGGGGSYHGAGGGAGRHWQTNEGSLLFQCES